MGNHWNVLGKAKTWCDDGVRRFPWTGWWNRYGGERSQRWSRWPTHLPFVWYWQLGRLREERNCMLREAKSSAHSHTGSRVLPQVWLSNWLRLRVRKYKRRTWKGVGCRQREALRQGGACRECSVEGGKAAQCTRSPGCDPRSPGLDAAPRPQWVASCASASPLRQ